MDPGRYKSRRRRWGRGVVLWLWLIVLGGVMQPAQADPAPEKGVFLVASENLMDPNFYRTVILLVSYGADEGAMGLVINRPTGILPRRILPGVDGLADYNGPMFFGGPVMLEHIVFLWRDGRAGDEGEPVFGSVRISASRDALESLAEQAADPGTLRIYAGYAGWSPGQLEMELTGGGWRVVAATESMVFSDDPGGVWERLQPAPEPLTAALLP